MFNPNGLLEASAYIFFGLIVLVWSADKLVEGASAVAFKLGVSTLLIGVTIIGMGTSAPEMAVGFLAAADNSGSLAIGNAVGSNIANISLILGVTAILAPLCYNSIALKREYPILIGATIIASFFLIDRTLSIIEGFILLGLLFAFLIFIFQIFKKNKNDPIGEDMLDNIDKESSLKKGILLIVIGGTLLLLSSKILVAGAVTVAEHFEVSKLIIGLTIIAIGTSLPELAAGIASVAKKQTDLAVGNVIGSNIFNTLAVLSIPGFMGPNPVDSIVIWRDLPIMIGLTLVFLLLGKCNDGRGRILRWQGAALLGIFFIYQTILISNAIN